MRRFIRLVAFLRYTHIVVEFWGMVKYDCLKELAWKEAYSKAEIRPIFQEAQELGLQIIPMYNHWGHATACRVKTGKHVVLDQNLALEPLFSSTVWEWNLANPEVVELHKNIRNELIELCGEGEYFHIGCDEAYSAALNWGETVFKSDKARQGIEIANILRKLDFPNGNYQNSGWTKNQIGEELS